MPAALRRVSGPTSSPSLILVVLILIVLALLAHPPTAVAQIRIVGAIAGTVTDVSDAVIPGAAVRLVDELTGIAKETVTNDSGGFVFPDLSFGSYKVTVTLQGFRTAVFENVTVESSRTTDLRVRLQVGAVDEQVQVKGVPPVLEMTSNVVSTTVNSTALHELPLNGRSTFGFARLTPGTQTPVGGETHYN